MPVFKIMANFDKESQGGAMCKADKINHKKEKVTKAFHDILETHEKEKMKSKVFNKVTKSYMKVSTIHGLSYIAEEGRPLLEKYVFMKSSC